MPNGIYTASSGGLLNSTQLDLTSNNLANVQTVGFKAERLVSRQQKFSDTLASTISDSPERAKSDQVRSPGVVSEGSATDFSLGPVQSTGNPLDVALSEGDTFFVVNTPEGEAFTRAGNFTLNAQGQLSTPEGFSVLGEGGPISIGKGLPSISDTGAITVDGKVVDVLRTVQVENPATLKRTSGVKFIPSPETRTQQVSAKVVPGSLEMANVNVVESIVELISTQRSFEAYSKVAKTLDEFNERAVRTARASG